MASVWHEPRKSGKDKTWLARWKSRKLKLSGSAICYTWSEYLDFEKKKRLELRDRELGLEPKSELLPWADFVKTYMKTRMLKAPATKEADRRALLLFGRFIRGMEIQRVTTDTLDDFKHHLLVIEYKKGRKYNQNSVGIFLRHLRIALRWAYKRRKIDRDPFAGFEMPPPIDVRRYVKPDEIVKLLADLPDLSRRALIFILYTGLRSGELLKLDWSMVSREGDKWILTASKSKVRTADVTREINTKTMALHPDVIAILGEPCKKGPIFPGMTKSMIQQALRDTRERLGLGRIRWHDLRHTWATDLMQIVKDVYALMAVGGWKSQAAASIYQHPTPARRDSTLLLPTRNTTEAGKEGSRRPDSSS